MIEIEKEFGIFFDYWDFQSEYGNMTDRLMMIGDQEAAYVSEPQREEFKVLEEALKSKEEILEQTSLLSLKYLDNKRAKTFVWYASVQAILDKAAPCKAVYETLD